MMSLVIVLGVILVVVILYMIFRIGTLVSVMRGPEKPGGFANQVNAFLLLIFMVVSLVGFFWYSFAHIKQYEIPVASEHGVITDQLFWITMIICVAATAVIFAVMFWITFKYQYKEGAKAKFVTDNHMLELVWTGIPAVVMALLIFKGLETWNDITDPAKEDAEVIELVAQQFAWTARYPGSDKQLGKIDFRLINGSNEFGLNLSADANTFDDFKAQELHIPKGKEVLLKIRAKDVLHSVYLPHFRVKMDAVPGMQTHFKFTPTKSTADMRTETGNPNFNYELACAEICGKGHFSMRLVVVVDEPADYEKWKASQAGVINQNFESALETLQNLENEKRKNKNIDMKKYQESVQREYSNYLLSYVPNDLKEVAFIKGIQGSVEKEVNGKKIIRTELQRRQQADSLISEALKYRQSDNNQVSASLK